MVKSLIAWILLMVLLLSGCNNNGKLPSIQPAESAQDKSTEETNSEVNSAEQIDASAQDNGSEVKEVKITEFKLDEYGAIADGKTDNLAMLNKVLNKVKYTVGKKKIVFGEGRYAFNPPDYSYVVHLSNLIDVEICGQGPDKTEILINNPKAGFVTFYKCDTVSVRNLSVDWDPVPFTQGVIVAKSDSEGTFDLKIDKGFPSPLDDWYQKAPANNPDAVRWGVLIDSKTNSMKPGVPDTVATTSKVEKLNNDTYRFYTSHGGAAVVRRGMEVGDKYAQIVRFTDGSGTGFLLCKNTLVENVNLYSCPGIGFNNFGSDGSVVRNVKVMIKPDSGRLITLNADAFHYQKNRKGPILENCFTEAMCDDAVHINHPPTKILEVKSPTELVVEETYNVFDNDEICIFNPYKGNVIGKARIVSVVKDGTSSGKSGLLVKLDQSINGITLKDDLRYSDQFYNLDSLGKGFVIKNNHFKQQRVRHIFIESHDGLIEGNVLEGAGTVSMLIANEAIFPLGVFPSNITIRNNRIMNSGTSKKWFESWAAIMVKTMVVPYGSDPYPTAENRSVTDIEIYGNEIMNSYYNSIYLGAVKNAKIYNNSFKADAEFKSWGDHDVIVVDNCEGIHLKDNTIEDPRNTVKSGVRIMKNNAPGDKGVKVDNLSVKLAAGVPGMLDERK